MDQFMREHSYTSTQLFISFHLLLLVFNEKFDLISTFLIILLSFLVTLSIIPKKGTWRFNESIRQR